MVKWGDLESAMVEAPVEIAAEEWQQLLKKIRACNSSVDRRKRVKSRNSAPDAQTPQGSGFGAAKGMLITVSDDDDHLADFAEYM